MRAIKAAAAIGLLGLGFGLGFVAPFSLYSYGQSDAGPFRVNRMSGVQQFATAKGWASTDELAVRDEAETKRLEADLAPEIARFGDRLAAMRAAERKGKLRKVEVTGRSVSAYFADGRKEEYYAIDVADPRLGELQTMAQRLALKEIGGATSGSAQE